MKSCGCSDPTACAPQSEIDSSYPSREQCVEAWEELARQIAGSVFPQNGDEGSEKPSPVNRGNLTVLGSGIESVGFTRDAEATITAADRVFFCVADPATVIWLRKLRPDAYDLYVFYEDSKPRYHTYVQMSEAILHPVRQGENVVAIFYGHPGVFVLSTHRAIEIARREGHRAQMKPGISALDCLCADLGIDPCHPGMVTYEATDMLIRRRHPDPTLHVILWQVGLIAQMGFRRKGFVNDKFQILIEYLQDIYGEDYQVTHYIAARYPTIEPTIETLSLIELLDPAHQAKVTGLSTFYLPPRDDTPTDPEMALRLGLIKPGQTVGPAKSQRDISSYGKRELRAIREFDDFRVPIDFQHQPLTRAGEFLVDLAGNPDLRALYISDPQKALATFGYDNLNDRETRALTMRDEGAIQIAAKGSTVSSPPRDQLVIRLLRSSELCKELQGTIRRGRDNENLSEELNRWLQANKFNLMPQDISSALRAINSVLLVPWTGAYYDQSSEMLVSVMGHPTTSQSLVFVNAERIRSFTYYNGIISWNSIENCCSGLLHFEPSSLRKGSRRLSGKIAGLGESEDASEIEFNGADLNSLSFDNVQGVDMAAFVGVYSANGLDFETKSLDQIELLPDQLRLGEESVKRFAFQDGKITWNCRENNFSRGKLTFLVDPITGRGFFFGSISSGGSLPAKANVYGCSESSMWAGRESESNTPGNILDSLRQISFRALEERGAPFWHEWRKTLYTTRVVNRILLPTLHKLIREKT